MNVHVIIDGLLFYCIYTVRVKLIELKADLTLTPRGQTEKHI